jgi:hypothetical protein
MYNKSLFVLLVFILSSLMIGSCNNNSEKKENYKVDPLVKRALGSFSAISEKCRKCRKSYHRSESIVRKNVIL